MPPSLLQCRVAILMMFPNSGLVTCHFTRSLARDQHITIHQSKSKTRYLDSLCYLKTTSVPYLFHLKPVLIVDQAILDNTYDWSRSNVRLLLAKDAPTYHTGVHISRDFVEVESIKMGTVNIHGSDYTMWRPDIVIRLSY